MRYVVAVLGGIVGAVAGWLVSAAAAVWIAGWCGMSDFEGGRGMFAAFVVGPVGGLLGMVGAAWAVLRAGERRAPFGRTVGRVAAVLGIIGLLIAAAIGLRLATLDTYTNEAPPRLEFELRLPAGVAAPDPTALRVELQTDKNVSPGQLDDAWIAADGGAHVITGSASLDFKTSGRVLVVGLPGQPARLFRLRLSRDPETTAAPGPWRRADHLDTPAEAQPRPAPADDPLELRARVRRAGDE